jgi:hypothetical protein
MVTRGGQGMARGFVYFIQAEANGYIKIGWTDGHPSFRLKTLETAAPCLLVSLGAVRGDSGLERDLHNLFGHLRSHGEWFRPGQELLAFIQKKAKPWPAKGSYETDPPGEDEWRKRQQRWMSDMSKLALLHIRSGAMQDPGHGYYG